MTQAFGANHRFTNTLDERIVSSPMTTTLASHADLKPEWLAQAQYPQVLQAIAERRSMKHYDANHVMPQSEVEALIRLAMLSPTSFNIQNWRFVVVTERGTLREQLKAAAWNQAQVWDASLVVLLCADLLASKRQPERYWRNAPESVQQMLVPMIGNYYDNNVELQRDEAMRSIGIASQTLMLAAKAMGYDSCPMVGFDPVKVAELVKLPADHTIGLMLTIGKATQPARERGGQLPLEDVMVVNGWQ
jgi:nitroreductase